LRFVGVNNTNQSIQFHAGANLFTPNSTADLLPHLFISQVDGANSTYEVSNLQVRTAGNMGANSWDYMVLGSARGLSVAEHLNMIFSEHAIIQGVLSTQDYDDIKNYYLARFAL